MGDFMSPDLVQERIDYERQMESVEEDDGDFSEGSDTIEEKVVRVVVNFKALPLEDDVEYQGSSDCMTSKEFKFKGLDDFEDKMDLMRVYLWNFYRDKTTKIINWRIICDE